MSGRSTWSVSQGRSLAGAVLEAALFVLTLGVAWSVAALREAFRHGPLARESADREATRRGGRAGARGRPRRRGVLRGTSVFSLEVDDCFNDPDSPAAELSDVDSVACEEPHDNEVYAIVDHPAGDEDPYPGVSALDDWSWNFCLAEFMECVGVTYDDSRLRPVVARPDRGRLGGRGRPRGHLLPLWLRPQATERFDEGQPRVSRRPGLAVEHSRS